MNYQSERNKLRLEDRNYLESTKKDQTCDPYFQYVAK